MEKQTKVDQNWKNYTKVFQSTTAAQLYECTPMHP